MSSAKFFSNAELLAFKSLLILMNSISEFMFACYFAKKLKNKAFLKRLTLESLFHYYIALTLFGHPNKMFRSPSPDRPIFFEK